MEHFNPGYDIFRKILREIKRSGKCMDYWEAMNADSFLILRHDIEFSVERAWRMAMIEKEEGITSSWFLQIKSNAYNAFSEKNMTLLNEMIQAGHHIGLHYHLGSDISHLHIRDEIRDQIRIMSEMLHYPVDRFSIHRPVEESKYYAIRINGVINAYSKEFFTHFENANPDSELEIKYITDSKHRWNYGYPDMATIQKYPKIQLLIHPYSWSETGLDAAGMFNEVADEKEKETLNTFDEETKIYRLVKAEVEARRGGI